MLAVQQVTAAIHPLMPPAVLVGFATIALSGLQMRRQSVPNGLGMKRQAGMELRQVTHNRLARGGARRHGWYKAAPPSRGGAKGTIKRIY